MQRAVSLVVVVLLAGLACGHDGAPTPRAPDERLLALHRQALIRREQVRAVVQNHLGHWSAVRKYRQLFQMFRVHERIPFGPRTDDLAIAIERLGREVGFREVRVRTLALAPAPPDLPETVETPGGYTFEPEEIAGTIQVTLSARPADLGLAERLVGRLRRDLPRLLVLRRVRLAAGEVTLEGEAFHFYDVRPPVQVIRAPDLAGDLAALGVSAEPPDVETAFLLLDLARLYGETAVDAALSGPSLREAAEATLASARFDFFKRRAAEAESVRWTDLLED